MVNKRDYANWGHTEGVSPSDWEDVREYIEELSKWDMYRQKYPRAFEIIDGRGKGIFYKEEARKRGRPPKGEHPSTPTTPIVDQKIHYITQKNGVDVSMIGGYLWPRETIEAIQNGTFKDLNYRGGPTIWQIWEIHNSFSLT
jgi:hypothetical protein